MIEETPGADRATSFADITDYVPGAYMRHDMLHMRGGHQTSWLIDGVNIPNTNIAANVGPQIDPYDTDQIEMQRGSYAADIGDRTYGVFNVAPRNGFELNRDAELRIYGRELLYRRSCAVRWAITRRRQPGMPAWPGPAPITGWQHRSRRLCTTPPIRRAASARFLRIRTRRTSSASTANCARTFSRFPSTRTKTTG